MSILNGKHLCIQGGYPTPFHALSYGQKALWFFYQMDTQSIAYNIFITVRIHSDLDIPAWHRAWQKVFERHCILRTTYTTYEGKPFQRIHEQQEVSIKVTNASNWNEDYLKKQILLETDRPFNLERDSVLRVNLFRLAQEDILLLTMHHIAGDMWSFNLLLNELQVLYATETEKVIYHKIEVVEDSLPKNLPYTEFVRWQSEMLSSLRGEELWEYWQKQLAGELPILNLPTDRSRPRVQSHRGATHILKLDEQLIQKLRNLAITSGTSLYKILLAAFYVQLYRYTNQEDILVGSPMVGRWGRKFKGIVGYFVNPVVLRVSVSGNPTFKEFLAQVSSKVKEAQKHQDYPFPLLVERLQQERDPSRSPLFQVGFTWQKQRWCEPLKNSSHIQEQGLHMEPYLLGHQRGAAFDLDVMVMEALGVLQACWQYNSDLFDGTTIERMMAHFQTLLEGIVVNPEQLLSQLPLLTESERQTLLVEWNNTFADYPQDKCIHQLFEAQVEQTPDAVAVVFEDQQLTYRELNCRANQLAQYLQALGVKPEILVGICVERSLEMVVGILGILKAGGAYVPLDPVYPGERLALMLEDAAVPVLLTQQRLVNRLPKQEAQVVCLDTQWERIAQCSEKNAACSVNVKNLTYIIYTSGSTGKPKGVMIEHRSLVNYTNAVTIEYGIQKCDRILQFASVSFDASAEEIYTCLTCGATLVLRTDSMLDSVSIFVQKCIDWKLSVLSLPTAYWHELTAKLSQENLVFPPSLGLVIIGGEKALPERLKTWQEYVGQRVRLVNSYGPTEATVVTTVDELAAPNPASRKLPIGRLTGLTFSPVQKVHQELKGCRLINGYEPTENTTFTCCDSITKPSPVKNSLPIGRPIANTQVYLLDDQMQPIPVGISGELYIGGSGLARGYLNRPDLTVEKFIPNPFSNEPDSRLYKSGDLARYLPDGNIEFLGRIDHQVKVRGFRIELREIEEVLTQHPDLREAAVVVREDIPGNKYLAAYVVPKLEAMSPASPPTIRELRSFLKAKLPDYMVPGAFVFLAAMPLTPSRKVDHHALPAPNNSLRELEDNFVAPSTPTEQILAAIWAEVLGLQVVGINNNFFELGGHSLLAASVISRIREAFSIKLPLSHLFEEPTIASLSHSIEIARNAASQEQFSSGMTLDTLLPLIPGARETHIPLSFAQQEIWLAHHINPDSCAGNSPIALRFTGELSPEVLEKSINEIIRRHEILRTTFPILEEQPVQVIAPFLTLPLKIVDLQHLPLEEREASALRLANQEAQHHFDLASGPLLQTTLLRLAPHEYWLLITMHHIITDGWSFGIFLQELGTLYNAFSNSLPSSFSATAKTPLPEVPIQYADFTLWQQQWLNDEVLQQQFSYWLKKLANIPASLNLLPADQPYNSTNSRRTSFYSIVLPSSLVASMEALSRSQSVTIFAIILTALKILLFKWSGQTDILVLTVTANRSTAEIEQMLGCFINDVILRSEVDDSQTGIALLEQVKQTVSEAIKNQDIPLFKVKEAISGVEFLRTVSVNMVPPVHCHKVYWSSQFLNCEVISVPFEREPWEEATPLELYVSSPTEDSHSIEIAVYYNTVLFTIETIERLFSYYQEILQQLVRHPEMKLGEFE